MRRKMESKNQMSFRDFFALGEAFFKGQTKDGAAKAEAGKKKAVLPDSTPKTQSSSFTPRYDNEYVIPKGAENFCIKDDATGSYTEKLKNNISALKVLKMVKGLATQAQKMALSLFVGFGGFPNAFKEGTEEAAQLHEILEREEYESLRKTTTTAFYTSKQIIDAMYDAVRRMGFKGGTVLEPSCGSGKFIGCIPSDMNCEVTAVELDKMTSGVAKALYPRANVINKGFEEVRVPNNYYDLAITNVPFGNIKVYDEEYKNICKKGFSIHEFFLAKMIDKVHDNGLIAVLISTYFMDSINSLKRKYIADRAELLAAFRIPEGTFAETRTSCDMLFFKKRTCVIDSDDSWINTTVMEKNPDKIKNHTYDTVSAFYKAVDLDYAFMRKEKFNINDYFIENPDNIMGIIQFRTNAYGKYVPQYIGEFDKFTVALGVPSDVYGEGSGAEELSKLPEGIVPNTYFIQEGEVCFAEGQKVVKKPDADKEMITSLINLRETVNHLLKEQQKGSSVSRPQLNREYDAFVEKYGRINSSSVRKQFFEDYSYPILCGLEVLDQKNNFKCKAGIFDMQTTYVVPDKYEHEENANTALLKSLRFFCKVDIDYICRITGKEKGELLSLLKGRIFFNPESRQYETAEEYLSGNIRKKLIAAEKSSLTENVEALREAMPQDVLAEDIEVSLGTKWVPVDIYEDFAREVIAGGNISTLNIYYSPKTVSYQIDAYYYGNERISTFWGVKGEDSSKDGFDLLLDCLECRETKIYMSVLQNGENVRVPDVAAMNEANIKQNEMSEAFNEWLHKDEERMARIASVYNMKFNSYVTREYDGSFLDFPMKSPDITLRKCQIDAVARILLHGNALIAHAVGAGKTYTIIAAAMEGKRLGLFQKPLIIVPKGLLGQWQADWLKLYPSARILCADEKTFATKNRANFISKIAFNDYDAIIMSYEQFSNITLSYELQTMYLEEDIRELKDFLNSLDCDNENRFTIKEIEKRLSNKEAALRTISSSVNRKKEYLDFEMLGIDKIFVDEAHFYKNLRIETKLSSISGVQTTSAVKTDQFYQITRYMNDTYHERGLVFATATPISNSMTEIYTMMRYLEPSVLKDFDVEHFDEWATTFGKIENQIELDPNGSTFRSVKKFSRFYNLPELVTAFHQVTDVKLKEDLQLNLPKAITVTVENELSQFQEMYMQSLVTRSEKIRAGGVNPAQDNMLLVTGDGKKLSIDPRILDASIKVDDSTSKLAMVCDKVYEHYMESTPMKGTQMIFLDTSTPNPAKEWTMYQAIKDKLINKGVPENEIVFIHSAETKAQRKKLFKDMNSGAVRVLIGSTSKMGTGVNAQERMVAVHHVDVPWRPSDIEQRNGRIVRRGNINEMVYIYRYVTKGSFDARAWQTVEDKQKFIGLLMRGHKNIGRSIDGDLFDEATLSFGEVKACALKDPRVRDYFALENELNALKIKVSGEKRQIQELNSKLHELPEKISIVSKRYEKLVLAEQEIKKHSAGMQGSEVFSCVVKNVEYDNRTDAADALGEALRKLPYDGREEVLGTYYGMQIIGRYESGFNNYSLGLGVPVEDSVCKLYCDDYIYSSQLKYHVFNKLTNIMNNVHDRTENMERRLNLLRENLVSVETELERAKFSSLEQQYKEKKRLYEELGSQLNLNGNSMGTAAIA